MILMVGQLATSADTRRFQLILGGREDDASSMKDVGKRSRRTEWQDAVRGQLSAINELPDNWDGYGARSIPSDTILFVAQILSEMWLPGLSVPDISPMSNEGLMVEWFTDKYELTLEVRSPYDIYYSIEQLDTNHVDEDRISQNIERLDPYLNLLVDMSANVVPAA